MRQMTRILSVFSIIPTQVATNRFCTCQNGFLSLSIPQRGGMSTENGIFTRLQAEESAISIIGSNLGFYSKIEKYVNKCSMNKALPPAGEDCILASIMSKKRFSFSTATPIRTFLEGISQHHQGRIHSRNNIKLFLGLTKPLLSKRDEVKPNDRMSDSLGICDV